METQWFVTTTTTGELEGEQRNKTTTTKKNERKANENLRAYDINAEEERVGGENGRKSATVFGQQMCSTLK